MRHTWFAAAVGMTCTAAFAFTPSAGADTYSTQGSAADVINNLQSKGYLVQINWTNGFDTKPLDLCWVTGVNNPGNIKPGGPGSPTVYVDVQCPNHDD